MIKSQEELKEKFQKELLVVQKEGFNLCLKMLAEFEKGLKESNPSSAGLLAFIICQLEEARNEIYRD